jgi:hypothetical protein
MNREDSLAKELKILKEALSLAKAGDAEGVAEKFVELCAHQQYVMEQEAYYATNEVIRNAQRYARSEVQARHKSGIPKADDQGET